MRTCAWTNTTSIKHTLRALPFPQQIWLPQLDADRRSNVPAPPTFLSSKLILFSPLSPPLPSKASSMPLFLPSSPTTNPVPKARECLAALFCEIASLGSFLLQVQFAAPWSTPNPATYDESVALTLQADNVAEEMWAIELAIYQLEACKETNKAWLRNHCPGHNALKETTNGWGT